MWITSSHDTSVATNKYTMKRLGYLKIKHKCIDIGLGAIFVRNCCSTRFFLII